jgi:ribosomal protein L20A (L18A)
VERSDYILFSGGAQGAEAEFGATAERWAIEEVNFGFQGHAFVRTRGVRILNHEELHAGDVSLAYVSRLMNRRYSDSPTFRKVLQSIWYQINSGQEIFVIGTILADGHVKGGTGWGAEFAKLCNKPLHVFDQSQNQWCSWEETGWRVREVDDLPRITHAHFTGTGTRVLQDNGARAIAALFQRSFGPR